MSPAPNFKQLDHDHSSSSVSCEKDSSLDDTKSSSYTNNMAPGDKEEDSAEVKRLVQKETRAVNGLRFLVLTVLVVAAILCSYGVHHAFTEKEYDAFLEEYYAISTRLVDLFRNDILHKLWVGQSLANSITVMIQAEQLQAPNITIPFFEKLVEASIKLAPVATVKWSPLLMDEEARRTFYAYAGSAGWVGDEADLERRQLLETSNISSPVWQVAPSFGEETNAQMYDLMSHEVFREAIMAVVQKQGPVLTQVYEMVEQEHEEHEGDDESEEDQDDRKRRSRRLDSSDSEDGGGDGVERAISMVFPVFESTNDTDHGNLIGSIILDFEWEDYLSGYLLVDAEEGESLSYEENIFDTDEVLVVLENTCGQTFTIQVDESSFQIVGEGDLHDPQFDYLVLATSFEEFDIDYASFGTGRENNPEAHDSHCAYRFLVYPTMELVEEHQTKEALLNSFVVALIFVFTSSIFVIYDCIVARRQRIITKRAIRTNAIVASFFPEAVRNRMMEDSKQGDRHSLMGKEATSKHAETDPIADFFPEGTLLFADIVGFTAWSSEREPTQVFKLLERTFHAFDVIAKQLGVFKVETIGDCYVAAVGIPIARDDHAVVCSRFARLIVDQMKLVCHDLEETLGPSTADLDIRIGMHSGPCTAGVLRGEKSRFQLFGDTMNTCARMESSGLPGRIHVSGETAKLLTEAGKGKWLILRQDTPELKGKGKMTSYWLRTKHDDTDVGSSKESDPGLRNIEETNHSLAAFDVKKSNTKPEKTRRLVEWNAKILTQLLQKVEASRTGKEKAAYSAAQRDLRDYNGSIIREVKDVLSLPQFDENKSSTVDPSSVSLPPDVVAQLKAFVEQLAAFYHAENPFHNFDHCSHVTMSVSKLLSRIVRTTNGLSPENEQQKTAADMHDNTFGITSDAIVQFAVVMSALIHDVDHPGVTNAVLVSENDPMAQRYNRKSVAEQNSVDLAFNLLMKPDFAALRACIYTNDEEFERFRSTIITLVLATDIMDKELAAQRKARWAKAFSGEEVLVDSQENEHMAVNRKATIVLEHLIQASDVAHTMQHWHVYKKWNEYLFQEVYEAYLAGRIDKDPSESWYKGEIGFFDFYIIPLAKKLETCGVFGVSSHEYLQYAEQNRQEWVVKGEEMVKDYLARITEVQQEAVGTISTLEAVMEQALPTLAVASEEKYRAEIWC